MRGPREIDQHPQKDRIIKALIRRESYRKIKERFGCSQAALSRYLNTKLRARVTKVRERMELGDGKTVLVLLEEIRAPMQKLLESCEKYLQDPENPDLYDLGPRDDDIMVNCAERDEEGRITGRRKVRLSKLLQFAGKMGVEVEHLQWRIADPRALIIKVAAEIRGQLELIGKLVGDIEPAQVSISTHPDFIELQQIILQVTADQPEMAEMIAQRIDQMARGAPEREAR